MRCEWLFVEAREIITKLKKLMRVDDTRSQICFLVHHHPSADLRGHAVIPTQVHEVGLNLRVSQLRLYNM